MSSLSRRDPAQSGILASKPVIIIQESWIRSINGAKRQIPEVSEMYEVPNNVDQYNNQVGTQVRLVADTVTPHTTRDSGFDGADDVPSYKASEVDCTEGGKSYTD